MDFKASLTTFCKAFNIYVPPIRYHIPEAEQPGELPPGEEGILGFSKARLLHVNV